MFDPNWTAPLFVFATLMAAPNGRCPAHPVKVKPLRNLKSSEFYCPGSILSLRTSVGKGTPDSSQFLLAGYPERSHAFFNRSLAFDVDPPSASSSTRVLATYAGNDVLASGWLLGESHIADKAAVVEVESGEGRILLFGFPPQHRAQTRGTFRLLFNALLRAGAKGSQPAG